MPKIEYWNRYTQKIETELVYGEEAVAWLYETSVGQKLADTILSRPFISKLYGATQSSRLSARKIPGFIERYQIKMEEYENPGYRSFNDFFVRAFRPGRRPFVSERTLLPAPSEARYFGFSEIRESQKFPVKGLNLTALELLGHSADTEAFMGGPVLLARLCPTDYHRFHFPDSGRTIKEYTMHGALHSVNPVALRYRGEIFTVNERHVSILETENLGKLAYIEVGALCVGKIVQTHAAGTPFKRGDQKGYFLFGGSTVILLGQPGSWIPDDDILKNTSEGRETFLRLGDHAGKTKEH